MSVKWLQPGIFHQVLEFRDTSNYSELRTLCAFVVTINLLTTEAHSQSVLQRRH
ncbi:hypothetical protein [Nostoc sp. MG11]|uniref:hypothetical protein n=1 Tax=Nostoc sp. MG11 TaxID=2721166 RepID=UPI0018691EFD|nr:hypothetical protein [Nostoc sp. MG11]